MDTIWHKDLLQSGIPKYRAILNAIRTALDNQIVSKGDRLPPVRELGWALGVTPGTVARAYQLGIDEGLLEAQVGRGTFIKDGDTAPSFQPTSFGETYVETGTIDLRNASIPNFGQDDVIAHLVHKIKLGGNHSIVRYAADSDMDARAALLGWSDLENTRARVEDLVLCYGSQNATLAAFLTIANGPSPLIATDTLVLPGTRAAATLTRARLKGLPSDEDGISPKALEELCRSDRPQILHLSANIHSPTTKMMSISRKSEIAEIARKYDIQIVEDDGHSKFFPERPPSFVDLCPERVWYVSSLSRYLAAGLRIGYLLCPYGKGVLGNVTMQSVSHSFSTVIAQLTTLMINEGYADQLFQKIKTHRAERVETAVNQLGRWDLRWHQAASFVWLEMPENTSASEFSLAAERANIQVAPADAFLAEDGVAPNAVRISLGGKHSHAVFSEALRKLDITLETPQSRIIA